MARMKVSLIATVLNEAQSLPAWLDALTTQTRQPDEVIVVDGGSTDDTVKLLNAYADRLPLTIIESPGANISTGRNIAIEAASGDVIACTDAGTRPDPGWLSALAGTFEDEDVQHAAGFFISDPHTAFELALGATTLPTRQEIAPDAFLPSSRSVAYRPDAVQNAGGYPEWLDYCEDLILDFNLRDLYGPFAWVPDAAVHFRPRPTLKAFFKQYYRYARGDGKADLWRKRHLIRYLSYFVALPLLLLAATMQNPAWAALLVSGGLYMVARPYARLVNQWQGWPTSDKVAAGLWVPVIRVAGDIAKMLGYPVGWVWRLRENPPSSRAKG